MSSYSDLKRDQRTADAFYGDAALNCSAHGCPNRWSYDAGTKLCTAHAAAQPHDWARVTAEQLDAQAELAVRQPSRPIPIRPLSHAEKIATLRKLAAVFKAKPSRGWIADLQARKDAGEYLTAAQRTMLRDAKGILPEAP